MATNNKLKGLEDIFSPVTREFGTTVAQVSIAITIAIGSLGFENDFNAGAWTVSCLLCLAVLYLFRYQMKFTVGTAGFLALFLLSVFIASAVAFADIPYLKDLLNGVVGADPARRKVVISAYWAVALTIPFGIILLSYRKQQATKGWTFPRQIVNTVEKQINGAEFYKKEVVYKVDFGEPKKNGRVAVETTMSYVVTNRTDTKKLWVAAFTSMDRGAEIKKIKINNEEIAAFNYPDLKTARGYEVKHTLPPGGSVAVEFCLVVDYFTDDGELYTTYDLATALTVSVKEPAGLKLRYENLYHERDSTVLRQKRQGRVVTELNSGVLPYQGVRITWTKKE